MFRSLAQKAARGSRRAVFAPRVLSLAALALGVAACEATPAPVGPAAGPPPELASSFAQALDAEARDASAARPYLDALELALARPEAPGALSTAIAALDALVYRSVSGFDDLPNHAIAYRSRELTAEVVGRLRAAWFAAKKPAGAGALVRGLVAQALHDVALYMGDARAAAAWGAKRGCATEAALIGPLDAAPLESLEDASPVPTAGALAQSYPGIAPFAARLPPITVRADMCRLDLSTSSFLQGERAVVVDLESPRAQRAFVALTSQSAAVLDIGGVRVLGRGFDLGGKPVMRLASVELPAGRVRVVARFAQRNDGNLIELDAWGADGLPLKAIAPRPGDVAPGVATNPRPIEIRPEGASAEDVELAAAAQLGLGEARAAEHLLESALGPPLEPRPAAPGAAAPAAAARPPALHLLYARAIVEADDLPDAKANERTRGAIDKVLAAWPTAWEAKASHARLTERRRGAGDGPVEALKELGVAPRAAVGAEAVPSSDAAGAPPVDRMVLAYASILARRAQLLDVAEQAYAALERVAPGSALLANVDTRVHRRIGVDAAAAACGSGRSRSDASCFEALRGTGRFDEGLAELRRLRALRGDPGALRAEEIGLRVQRGDLKGALAVYDTLPPAQRDMLSVLGFAAGHGAADEARSRLARDRLTSRDAPYGIWPLQAALGAEDPAVKLEAEGSALVAKDREHAFLPGAGTAVLRHLERYTIEASGLTSYLFYDLRRVSGTTDVETGAQSYGPRVEGRGAPRLLRRRIHKKDGRVLVPDAASFASQGHADLSQLETGDYVEQILAGHALPGDSGQLVLDTPDLLPERTSVRDAEIRVRRASSIPVTMWSHPLLGKPITSRDGGYDESVWRLTDQAPRRIEDGVPRMERGVSVSVGTQTWKQISRFMSDNLRSLDEHDPFVARWAAEAAGADKTPSRALVERVVAAAGKKVKVASGAELADVSAVFSGGAQSESARTILELGQGSRSWVVYRALRELGVEVELAVAELEPWSTSADFPPHVGRFRKPLVVAHLHAAPPAGPEKRAAGDAAPVREDLWIDADVEGPPLPPGRVSPELRGRSAMLPSGVLVQVEGASGEGGDEVDVRLTLDPKGVAKGTFTVLLHGRPAQALAESFETVVGTDRRLMLRSVVLGWLPWADVDDVSLSSTEGSWEVALRAQISIQGYGRPEGKDGKTWVLPGLEPVHIVFPRTFVGTLGATYASRGARQSALSVESAIQYHVHRRVELPAGATIARAPAGVAVHDKRIEASRKGVFDGKAIEEDFSLSLPTQTVAADGYPTFVEAVHQIDDGFMAGTRVKVGP